MSVLTVWPEVALPGLWISGQYSRPTSKIHVLIRRNHEKEYLNVFVLLFLLWMFQIHSTCKHPPSHSMSFLARVKTPLVVKRFGFNVRNVETHRQKHSAGGPGDL